MTETLEAIPPRMLDQSDPQRTLPTGWTGWDELRANLRGRLITPDEEGWDAARRGWAVNIDQQPAAVLECADADDVVAAVRWAIEHNIRISAQPRGHAARTTLDGTLVLRTGGLQDLEVHVAQRWARVGAGVSTGTLLSALSGSGLIFLAGSSTDPSVVGVTLGGGVSWFSRRYGFAANSVRGFDVVDAEGVRRRIDAGTDADLFWALRGGGGDFAVVLSMDIELKPEPEIYGGRLLFPIEHTSDVLYAFRDLTDAAPPALTAWAQVFHFPAAPSIPEDVRGRSFACITSTFLGCSTEAEPWLARIRECAPVIADFMGPVPIGSLGQVAAEPVDPMPTIEHSALLTELDDDTIAHIAELITDPARCPMLTVQIRHLGGACADRAADDGCVRAADEPFGLLAVGVPVVADAAAAISNAWEVMARGLAGVLSPHRLPNFTGAAQTNAAGYDAPALERLRNLKKQRDPRGMIRSNRPVLEP